MKTYFSPLVLFTSGSYRIESKHYIFILIILFCSILPFRVSAQIKVTSTNDVGIGTDSPQSKLDVNGAVKISTLDTNAPNNPQTPNGATKMVITDTDGKLSFTDMPTGGVQGSGQINRLTFWNTNNTLSFANNSFWDNTNFRLGLGTNLPSRQLTTTQDIEVNSIRIGKGNGNVFNNLAIGYNALLSNTTGSGNLSVGYEALQNSLTSNDNIAIGVQAMKLSTSANNNTAIGYRSLYKVGTTGSGGIQNTAIGYGTFSNLTSGIQNTAVGEYSGLNLTIGNYNTMVGAGSGSALTVGSQNLILGSLAGQSLTTQGGNTAVGVQSMRYATGSHNIGIGNSVMVNTSSSENVAIGGLASLTSGYSSTAVGISALGSVTTGNFNTALGWRAGWQGNGNNNIFIGNYAGAFETGGGKLLIGSVENYSEVTGRSTAIIHGTMSGTSSSQILDLNAKVKPTYKPNLAQSLSGYDSEGYFANVSLGLGLVINNGVLSSTGGNLTGTGAHNRVAFWTGTNGLSFNNNFVWDNGNGRLGIGTTIPSHQLTTSEDILINNVEIGRGAGSNNTTNIKIGQFSLINNTTGHSNVALGLSGMGANTSGHSNTALGSHSLQNNTIGSLNTAIGRYSLNANTEGSDNIAIGPYNLHNNSIGNRNVSIGASALFNNNGSNNSALGWQALYSNLTGSGNVGIGNRAGFSETGSNKLYIENSNSNQPLIGGDFSQNRVGINTEISQISKTLHVTGDARITALATNNTPPITSGQERMVITDSNGDLSFTSIPQGGGGTVTSISGNNGIATTPLIITSTGTVGLTGNALSLHNLATPGIVAMTAPGALAARTITAGQGISITNGNGVNGNPTISNIGAQYAQLYTTAHLTNLVLNSTAANIPFTISSANGMQTAPNHSYIEIPQTGFYEISYSLSYKVERDIHGSSIANLNFEVYSDQSPLGYLTQCNSRNFENTNSNLTSVSRSFVVQLVQSAFVQLFYKKTNGTPEEVTFYNPQFSIKRLY